LKLKEHELLLLLAFRWLVKKKRRLEGVRTVERRRAKHEIDSPPVTRILCDIVMRGGNLIVEGNRKIDHELSQFIGKVGD